MARTGSGCAVTGPSASASASLAGSWCGAVALTPHSPGHLALAGAVRRTDPSRRASTVGAGRRGRARRLTPRELSLGRGERVEQRPSPVRTAHKFATERLVPMDHDEPDDGFRDAEDWEAEALRNRMAVLEAAVSACAEAQPLDMTELAAELGLEEASVDRILGELDELGLCSRPLREPGPPLVCDAGRQYLERRGDVPSDALGFLARFVDDLDARAALLEGCTAVVDDFSGALLDGQGVEHARSVVPPAFRAAVDDKLALRLFAATVALTTRLAETVPAGCVAEEIVAVSVLVSARSHLDGRNEDGDLTADQLEHAVNELHGVFELFQDDDVLNLFDMEEPADAALAGHSDLNARLAVVDQRLDAWFRPFVWALPTGYLDPRPGDESAGSG